MTLVQSSSDALTAERRSSYDPLTHGNWRQSIPAHHAVLKVQTKEVNEVADVVITLKIMPESPDVDLDALEKKATEIINTVGEVGKKEIEPIAFGLKALKLIFVMDENKGSTDDMEAQVANLDEVNSAEVIDVRRAVG